MKQGMGWMFTQGEKLEDILGRAVPYFKLKYGIDPAEIEVSPRDGFGDVESVSFDTISMSVTNSNSVLPRHILLGEIPLDYRIKEFNEDI